MTTNRTDRSSSVNPGTPMTGGLLEQWCKNASADPRDWYTMADRRHAVQTFAAAVEQSRAAGRRPRVPAKLILIECERGEGKSLVGDYFSSQYAWAGAEVYHTGCFGYGRTLAPDEWFTAMNNVNPGSVVFIDEGASVNRQGRDQADIQAIQNEQATALRKQECLVFYASAMSRRMGRTLREEADEIWRPQKMKVVLGERERRRRRHRRVRAKDDPANFAYSVLRSDGKPYRPASIFDEVLGQERENDYKPPVYRKVLDPVWMRLVMPLLDTFKPVPIGAALAVSREAIIDMATGREPKAHNKQQRLVDVVVGLAQAFNEGTLPVPPEPEPGTVYVPVYMTPTQIRNATPLDLSPREFGAVLREELRLDRHDKGYEVLELYEAVEKTVEFWNQQQGTVG